MSVPDPDYDRYFSRDRKRWLYPIDNPFVEIDEEEDDDWEVLEDEDLKVWQKSLEDDKDKEFAERMKKIFAKMEDNKTNERF